jgi:DNA-binding CsgD family transcriptional regulator
MKATDLEMVLRNGARLTPFERIVIEYYRQKRSDMFIAKMLDVAPVTLRNAVAEIRVKLDASLGCSLDEAAEHWSIPRFHGPVTL